MNKKQDLELMRILKVDALAKPICNTSNGLLNLVIRKDNETYYLTLDAVPLSEEQNAQLLKLLYGKEILELFGTKENL